MFASPQSSSLWAHCCFLPPTFINGIAYCKTVSKKIALPMCSCMSLAQDTNKLGIVHKNIAPQNSIGVPFKMTLTN